MATCTRSEPLGAMVKFMPVVVAFTQAVPVQYWICAPLAMVDVPDTMSKPVIVQPVTLLTKNSAHPAPSLTVIEFTVGSRSSSSGPVVSISGPAFGLTSGPYLVPEPLSTMVVSAAAERLGVPETFAFSANFSAPSYVASCSEVMFTRT